MQDHLLVVSECLLDVLHLALLKRNFERLVEVVFELCIVELLAHVNVPVGLRHDARYEPERILKVIIVRVFNILWLWQWS